MHPVLQTRIAVVGAGGLGAGFAHALLLSNFNLEIIFIDGVPERAAESVLDLQQAMIFSRPHEIRAGDFSDLALADLVIVSGAPAAGPSSAKINEHTWELVRRVGRDVARANPGVLLLVGGAPNDQLTYVTWKLSGVPRNQVIGTGTMELSATLRFLLGRHFRVDPRSVHVYVLGGDGGQVPIWSSATIAGMSLEEACKAHGCPPSVLNSIFLEAQNRVDKAATRGHDRFSAGAALAWLAASVLRNEHHIFAVSTVLHHEYGMTDSAFSVPAVIGESGVERILRVEVNDDELPDLMASGFRTQEMIRKIGLAETERAQAS